MNRDRLEALADRLEVISGELGDLAIEELREAIADRAARRPESERRISQARRAVDKAVHLLRRGDDPNSEPTDD